MKKNMNSKIFLPSNVRSIICGPINCLDSDEIGVYLEKFIKMKNNY